MVAPTGWHGRGFAMGEWQDLLLQGRKLLEVQRPVSMTLFSPNFDFMISSKSKFFRRFTIDSGDPPFPRDAQDWLFGCYESNEVQVRERQQGHFSISWFCFVCHWECFQKRVITLRSTLEVKSFDLQVGELEEPLVIERTVSSSNPFLVMTSFFSGISWYFPQNEDNQDDLGVGDEVLDVIPFDERGDVFEWGNNPKVPKPRIPRHWDTEGVTELLEKPFFLCKVR